MSKQQLLIGSPRNKPEALIASLNKFFITVTSVKKAYIAQVFNPAVNEPPHLSIGLVLEDDLKNIANDLNEIIRNHTAEGSFIDVIDISGGNMKDSFAHLIPFYVEN